MQQNANSVYRVSFTWLIKAENKLFCVAAEKEKLHQHQLTPQRTALDRPRPAGPAFLAANNNTPFTIGQEAEWDA